MGSSFIFHALCELRSRACGSAWIFYYYITLLSEQSGVECVCVCVVLRVVQNFVVAYVQHYGICREKNQPVETTR